MGLLTLGAILRNHGCQVSYIDCLDRYHPKAPYSDPFSRYGKGHYLKTRIATPKGLEDVPRRFSRYGILPEWLDEDLKSLARPDIIMVTSLMSYWYPGVRDTIEQVKEHFADVPVLLGGVYATLCQSHAETYTRADRVLTGSAERYILPLIAEFTGFTPRPDFDPRNLDSYPYPAFDLQNQVTYIPLLTSRGCPFSCAYCASGYLEPRRMVRSPENVFREILYWHENYGTIDFVFYDDALLMDAHLLIEPLLKQVITSGIKLRFHTPNGMHIRGITRNIARLMHSAGFVTLRLGLETAVFDGRDRLDKKVEEKDFKKAVRYLRDAGFDETHVGAYLLVGLPNQTYDHVKTSVQIVKQAGITPIFAYYSPIPHTALWESAKASSRYDLENDPIFTNNAIFPCRKDPFSWDWISPLKQLL